MRSSPSPLPSGWALTSSGSAGGAPRACVRSNFGAAPCSLLAPQCRLGQQRDLQLRMGLGPRHGQRQALRNVPGASFNLLRTPILPPLLLLVAPPVVSCLVCPAVVRRAGSPVDPRQKLRRKWNPELGQSRGCSLGLPWTYQARAHHADAVALLQPRPRASQGRSREGGRSRGHCGPPGRSTAPLFCGCYHSARRARGCTGPLFCGRCPSGANGAAGRVH